MILRRIIDHVKEQNWTAIALDFFIVVSGVFIGMQVSNWNEVRAERVTEKKILVRLHEEALALKETRKGSYDNRIGIFDRYKSAVRMLYGITPIEDFTRDECIGIAVSHIYTQPSDTISVIDDLISTGRLDLISDEKLRAAISKFIRERDSGRNVINAVNQEIYRLPVQFPHLIKRSLVADPEDEDGGKPDLECDPVAMRADQKFLNELLDNGGRYSAYLSSVFEEVDEALDEMIAIMDGAAPASGDSEAAK